MEQPPEEATPSGKHLGPTNGGNYKTQRNNPEVATAMLSTLTGD